MAGRTPEGRACSQHIRVEFGRGWGEYPPL